MKTIADVPVTGDLIWDSVSNDCSDYFSLHLYGVEKIRLDNRAGSSNIPSSKVSMLSCRDFYSYSFFMTSGSNGTQNFSPSFCMNVSPISLGRSIIYDNPKVELFSDEGKFKGLIKISNGESFFVNNCHYRKNQILPFTSLDRFALSIVPKGDFIEMINGVLPGGYGFNYCKGKDIFDFLDVHNYISAEFCGENLDGYSRVKNVKGPERDVFHH